VIEALEMERRPLLAEPTHNRRFASLEKVSNVGVIDISDDSKLERLAPLLVGV
jgi:hypothetical protein